MRLTTPVRWPDPLSAPTLARVVLWGLVNWWADIACLAFAMWAAGLTGVSVGKIVISLQ